MTPDPRPHTPDSKPPDLRKLVAQTMRARKLSRYRLAHAAGVPYSTLHVWLSGQAPNINSGHLARLLAALGLEVVHSDHRGRAEASSGGS